MPKKPASWTFALTAESGGRWAEATAHLAGADGRMAALIWIER